MLPIKFYYYTFIGKINKAMAIDLIIVYVVSDSYDMLLKNIQFVFLVSLDKLN
jgi:hypothetical protein